MSLRDHDFGGNWTEHKLKHISSYLDAYLTAMKNQEWAELLYLDCFAGTGYRTKEAKPAAADFPLFEEELAEDDVEAALAQDISERYRDGSARIALQKPGFRRYVFAEKAKKKCQALHQLREDFPSKCIEIHQGDANNFLQRVVSQWNWRTLRACVFIDPYGMQLEWASLEALASTKGTDVWILMPVGVGVNRMLTRTGKISKSWEARLTKFFGCPPSEWRPKIYRETGQGVLFGDESETKKVPRLEEIAQYLVERLGEIFEGVAQNPLPLGPPGKAPLFYLFFAAANPKGAPHAIRIAEHILGAASRPKSGRRARVRSSSFGPPPTA